MYKNKNLELYNLLLEESNVGGFLHTIADAYPDSVYVLAFLKKFIQDSGCKNILFKKFKNTNIGGFSLIDGVFINEIYLINNFSHLLYTIFHEIAHQFQYKKYKHRIYDMYTEKIDISEASDFMKFIENTADNFALRKMREVKKLFGDKVPIHIPQNGVYDNYDAKNFEPLIKKLRKEVKKMNLTNKDDISEFVFNIFKNY